MCFDWDEFIAGYYKGLAFRVGGLQYYGSPNYDKSMPLVPFDLDRASLLLAEAGMVRP